jgi:hypothetical protein
MRMGVATTDDLPAWLRTLGYSHAEAFTIASTYACKIGERIHGQDKAEDVFTEVDLLDMLQDAVDEVSAEGQEVGSRRRRGGAPGR